MHIRLLLAGIFCSWQTYGQFVEDFQDGDISRNPIWVGDTTLFVVTDSNELQLNDTGFSKIAFVATECRVVFDAQWRFQVRMEFNPSSSNYCKIYVASSVSELSAPLNGYYIKAGGTLDNISLYRQEGNDDSLMIEGRSGLLNHVSNNVFIRLDRLKNGTWILYSDTTDGSRFFEEGRSHDPNYFASTHFGVVCTYTKTRKDKFFFDNIAVKGSITVPDTIPPIVKSALISDKSNAVIKFSEFVRGETARDFNNYVLSDANKLSHIQRINQSEIKLFFHDHLHSGDTIDIGISNIEDMAGNLLADTTLELVFINFLTPRRHDVVISEFLPDPLPSYGLPDCEYIELYNRTNEFILLENCRIEDAQSSGILTGSIAPASYMIVCPKEKCALFDHAYGCTEVDKFPSLNNSGDHILLKNEYGEVVTELKYSSNWFETDLSKEGGISVELIDPNLTCFGKYNYHASRHPFGGTPGFENTPANIPIFSSGIREVSYTEDYIQLKTYAPLDTLKKDKIVLTCDGQLPSTDLLITSEYDMFIPYAYFPFQNLRYSCTIQLPFCHDRSYPKNSFTLTLPTPRLKKANVVINELYFNPPPYGSDFLELYNPSRDYISTTQLMLTNGRDSLHLKNCLPHMTIAPGEYIVLTNDTSFILERFTKSSNIRFLQVKDLVKMPDDSGTIYLVSASHQLIDVVHYNESYHSIYLHDAEDITLERIHPLFSGTKANNWASASAQDHYGTPGQKNSQLISNYPKTKIIPSVLSPNGDGAADVLHVHLTFPETGCLCSAAIFDINGVCHSILQRAELMPVNHVITWYGTNFKGDLVGPGGYFVYLECYSPTGMKSIQKLPFYVDN